MSKKRGSSLIVVIMVMAVLTILGVSILNISLSQTLQAAQEDKRIQAYYLARSGADAALSAWQSAPANNKPSGTANTVYLDSSNQFFFGTQPPSNIIGKFDVTISNNSDYIHIISVGTVGNVSQTVIATIKPVATEGTPPSSQADGSSLNWYDSKSGQATDDPHTIGSAGVTVMVSGPGVKVIKNDVSYQADSINFTSSADLTKIHNQMTLTAGTIIFEQKNIETNTNGSNNGVIVLKVLNGEGVTGPSGNVCGRVEYGGQWYYYPDNTTIESPLDFNKLVKISSTDTNNPGEAMQEITSYSILWSDQ